MEKTNIFVCDNLFRNIKDLSKRNNLYPFCDCRCFSCRNCHRLKKI